MQSYPSPSAVDADRGGPFYSSSGQQQPGIPNSDELQLTAQLSRGLEPIMSAGPGGNMTESQDPRGPSQGNVNHQYEHDQVRSAQMQPGHAPMDQMGSQYGTPDGSMAPRKRSKVSRACDECRRKKIRCDATGETENEQCSSCKRVGTHCQFSRVPMKRGPSKGYIKELADRLQQIEGAMSSGEVPVSFLQHHDSPLQRRPSEEFSPPPNPDSSQRKRTYSAVSNDFGSYLPQRNLPSWSPSDPARHLPHPAPATFSSQSAPQGLFKETNYSPNGMQPAPQWRGVPEQHPQGAFADPGAQDAHSDYALDWDEGVIDSYYQYIHPTFKLLHSNKPRLHARIDSAPVTLKMAFYEALHLAVRSFPSSIHQPVELQSTRKAAHLLLSAQFDNHTPRSFPTDLLHLQTLLLLAIAFNNSPSVALRPQFALTKSNWLVEAVELAYSMKLHQQKHEVPGDDMESDEKVARRLWWALITMDRWSAFSLGRPALIPDSSITVHVDEQPVLGESPYHLARLSVTLDNATTLICLNADQPTLSFNPGPYGRVNRGELEKFRESLPDTVFPPSQAPVLHICYWHVRILIELNLMDSEPKEMLDAVLNLLTQLIHNGVLSPLIHYCTILCALALIELLEYEDSREKADAGLKVLLDNRKPLSSWDAAVRDLISNQLQRPPNAPLGMSTAESQHASVASQSLQRLADLATATEAGRDVAGGEERKEGDDKGASASAPVPAGPAKHFKYYANLRRLVRNGILYALPIGGESAR
ncbi:hypothetical protein EG329_010317 [Mollisiaceae sp. DMI_Dod_QoI]|nr:hypothetical protein EG329_010317 [Helotiales sp. DMI_Dod_QoI]